MDNTDDEEQVLTEVTIEIALPPPISAVPVVVMISPIDIEEPQMQPVTNTLYFSSSTTRTVSTFALTFSYGLPIVVTVAPTEIENHHFNLLLIHFCIVMQYLLIYHPFLYQGNHQKIKLAI